MGTGASATPRRHLLLVTHHYAPENGAPQRRWDALTPRLRAAGVDVSVLAPPPHYPSGRLAEARPEYRPGRASTGRHGERIVRTRFREHTPRLRSRALDQAIAAASSVWHGARIFRHGSRRPDVVVGSVPGIPSMFAAWMLARLLGARFVVEMRDAWPDLIEPAGVLRSGGSLPTRLLRAVRRAVHGAVSRMQARADSVITTTEAFAEVLRGRGLHRVAVVRNGTSFAPLGDDVDDGRHRLLTDRPLRVVYAGTIGRAQDLATVVRAAAEMMSRGKRLEVRFVGTGAEVASLRALVDRLDAPVEIGGIVPHQTVRTLYRWADTVVVPLQRWTPLEWTVPSKLYEVMASGRHVTACVAGEPADLVRKTGAGTVVPPGDVEALADLWCGWVQDGAAPPADPAASSWVADHADDDSLGRQYVQIVDHVVRSAAPSSVGVPESCPSPCRTCAELGLAPSLPDARSDGPRTGR